MILLVVVVPHVLMARDGICERAHERSVARMARQEAAAVATTDIVLRR